MANYLPQIANANANAVANNNFPFCMPKLDNIPSVATLTAPNEFLLHIFLSSKFLLSNTN